MTVRSIPNLYVRFLFDRNSHNQYVDRVSPLHSFKFIAEVQHKLGNRKEQVKPLLLRVECDVSVQPTY